jgi:hypothetical protein
MTAKPLVEGGEDKGQNIPLWRDRTEESLV